MPPDAATNHLPHTPPCRNLSAGEDRMQSHTGHADPQAWAVEPVVIVPCRCQLDSSDGAGPLASAMNLSGFCPERTREGPKTTYPRIPSHLNNVERRRPDKGISRLNIFPALQGRGSPGGSNRLDSSRCIICPKARLHARSVPPVENVDRCFAIGIVPVPARGADEDS